MNYPYVFLFYINNNIFCKIISIVAMSEENAIEKIKGKYSNCYVELLESISIQNLGEIKEICNIEG